MSFTDYCRAFSRAMDQNPGWRYGQAMFNVLHDLRPDLAERIRGTDLDPFYVDATVTQDRINAFLTFVYENWDKEIK